MRHDNAAVTILVDQQARKFKSELTRWTYQIKSTRSTIDAFRTAAHTPNPGNLIRSLNYLYSSDLARAKRDVEKNLSDRVDQIKGDDPQITTLLRLAQGHWPQIYRKIHALHSEAYQARKAAKASDPN
jgi:hypothetical protein